MSMLGVGKKSKICRRSAEWQYTKTTILGARISYRIRGSRVVVERGQGVEGGVGELLPSRLGVDKIDVMQPEVLDSAARASSKHCELM
jgi:hypothetical protein